MVRAAVFHQTGQDKVEIVDDMRVLGPDAGEVKVRIRATGVCRSDLSALHGTLPQPPPCVLGHEGAGEVVEVGTGVQGFAPGDRVIITFAPPCGTCTVCVKGSPNLCMTHLLSSFGNPRFVAGDTKYFGFAGIGTFAEELTLPPNALVKVADDVPFDVGALIGCGVMTGVGSVINVAKVRPGDSVAIIGVGGVGISVVQGAVVAGAAQIVAVDMVQQKLDWARQFGATHAVTPADLEDAKRELTGGDGFDHVFDVVGSSRTIRTAYDATRRGGQTVIVGVGRMDDPVSFTPFELFLSDRTILPSTYGGADVQTDFHRLLALWRAGRLDLDRMITTRLALDDVNDAFAALEAGEVIRQVIVFD
jgi:S-(hydroxymethyl)glutathione dehydrogenase / alcohol dehydrogenase